MGSDGISSSKQPGIIMTRPVESGQIATPQQLKDTVRGFADRYTQFKAGLKAGEVEKIEAELRKFAGLDFSYPCAFVLIPIRDAEAAFVGSEFGERAENTAIGDTRVSSYLESNGILQIIGIISEHEDDYTYRYGNIPLAAIALKTDLRDEFRSLPELALLVGGSFNQRTSKVTGWLFFESE